MSNNSSNIVRFCASLAPVVGGDESSTKGRFSGDAIMCSTTIKAKGKNATYSMYDVSGIEGARLFVVPWSACFSDDGVSAMLDGRYLSVTTVDGSDTEVMIGGDYQEGQLIHINYFLVSQDMRDIIVANVS